MDVPDLHIAWSHTYISDDIVEVPGFTASLPSVVSTGVYVQVALTPKGDELRLMVGTSCRTWMWSFHSVYSQPMRGLEICLSFLPGLPLPLAFLSTSKKDFLEVERGPWERDWPCLCQTLK